MKLTPKIFFLNFKSYATALRSRIDSFFFYEFLKTFLRFENLEYLTCVFHKIWVKFVMGVSLGKEQHRMSLKRLWIFFD